MKTRIICYGNEKDCRCYIEVPGIELHDARRIYEAIYEKFNKIAHVSWSDTKILIKNIFDCTPSSHPENIELVVNMCEDILFKMYPLAWAGQNNGDNDFEFSMKW
jgi:hypothetical protein